MIVAGLLVGLLGIGLTVAGLVGFVMRVHALRRLRRLRAAPRWSCGGSEAAGGRPRFVVVTGSTAPGPQGVLRSVAFDDECVWFRTDVVSVEPGGTSSSTVAGDSSALFRRRSPGLIGISDGTGRALVDVGRVADRLGDGLARRRAEDSSLSLRKGALEGSGMWRLDQAGLLPLRSHGLVFGKTLELREERIEPGRRITALGRPRRARDGSLVLAGGGLALSGDEPDQWIETLERSAADSAVIGGMLSIGLLVALVGAAIVTAGVVLS